MTFRNRERSDEMSFHSESVVSKVALIWIKVKEGEANRLSRRRMCEGVIHVTGYPCKRKGKKGRPIVRWLKPATISLELTVSRLQ